jgi:hypothetical protein
MNCRYLARTEKAYGSRRTLLTVELTQIEKEIPEIWSFGWWPPAKRPDFRTSFIHLRKS